MWNQNASSSTLASFTGGTNGSRSTATANSRHAATSWPYDLRLLGLFLSCQGRALHRPHVADLQESRHFTGDRLHRRSPPHRPPYRQLRHRLFRLESRARRSLRLASSAISSASLPTTLLSAARPHRIAAKQQEVSTC